MIPNPNEIESAEGSGFLSITPNVAAGEAEAIAADVADFVATKPTSGTDVG